MSKLDVENMTDEEATRTLTEFLAYIMGGINYGLDETNFPARRLTLFIDVEDASSKLPLIATTHENANDARRTIGRVARENAKGNGLALVVVKEVPPETGQ